MKRLLMLGLLLGATMAAQAETRTFSQEAFYHVCKSSTQDCQAFMANEIHGAMHSIVYPQSWSNSSVLMEALLSAKSRGVAVVGLSDLSQEFLRNTQSRVGSQNGAQNVAVIDKKRVYFISHKSIDNNHNAMSVIHVNDTYFAEQVMMQVTAKTDRESLNTQNTTCRVIIPAKYNGNYEVYGDINGREVNFLVDTGATYVTVPAYLAKELGLKAQMTSHAQTATSRITAQITWIDELKVGPIVLKNVKAAILPDSNNRKVLLGMSALHKMDFLQQQDNLVLIQYTDNPSAAPCVMDASQRQ